MVQQHPTPDKGPTLDDLSDGLLLGHLLPLLPVKDLVALSQVDRRFYQLSTENTLWERLIVRDHGYTPPRAYYHSNTRVSLAEVYRRLCNSQPYVWGSTGQGRLGRDEDTLDKTSRFRGFVSSPVRLYPRRRQARGAGKQAWEETFKETIERITGTAPEQRGPGPVDDHEQGRMMQDSDEIGTWIDIQAGISGGAMRSSTGRIQVWGRLDASWLDPLAEDWTNPHFVVREPTTIPLPCKAVQMVFSTNHMILLDEDNLVWEMPYNFGRAYHHTSPFLCAPTTIGSARTPGHIIKIAAGLDFSACLTAEGEIVIWYPKTKEYKASLTPKDQLNYTRCQASGPHLAWGKVGPDVCYILPAIGTGMPSGYEPNAAATKGNHCPTADGKIIDIACGYTSIAARRANGEIWAKKSQDRRILAALPWVFVEDVSGPDVTSVSGKDFYITSVTSSGLVRTISNWENTRKSLSSSLLENETVIDAQSTGSITLALTASGKVFSWGGKGNQTHLGLGSVEHSEHPQVVTFGRNDDFAYAIALGSKHSAALLLGPSDTARANPSNHKVLRLRGGGEGGVGEKPSVTDDNEPSGHAGRAIGNHPSPSRGLRAPMFRIGFAGRHAVRGGPSRAETEEHAKEESTGKAPPQGTRGRGGPVFRVGFAARGAASNAAVRGRGPTDAPQGNSGQSAK